ncbi:hypothetical protein [Saccharopolyspora rosea]|uniref:Uncharacterized protein n=1 Tax=Saccharopolyspora rosea TaxID=524884 RepID=A0ABW3FN38_9PSEU|nr:hypothetical protein [Saccharopolyspora rosea]
MSDPVRTAESAPPRVDRLEANPVGLVDHDRLVPDPLLGGVGMGAVPWLLVANLGTAPGKAATPLFHLIPWLVAGLLAAGPVGALLLRRVRPGTYRVLGRIVLEDPRERGAAPT